jgi:hypothetical protein
MRQSSLEAGPSIHEHLVRHTGPDGQLSEAAATLPDERERGGVWYAPGARDGIATHHVGRSGDHAGVVRVVGALREQAVRPASRRAWERLYTVLREHDALGVVDGLTKVMLGSTLLPADRLYETGLRLATTSAHREPVKYGIALVGVTGSRADVELLHQLGRHDEFTLYSAVALAAVSPDPESEWWRLAKQVRGWGRIHLVERLEDTERADIRRWILVDGFRNTVMDEYLAHIAAVTGNLAGELAGDPDDEVLDAACAIVSALINGGPAEDMDSYADGPRAVSLLMAALTRRATRPEHLEAARAVKAFVTNPNADWAARAQRGWTPELRLEFVAGYAELASRADSP